jgi:hypothetical protein
MQADNYQNGVRSVPMIDQIQNPFFTLALLSAISPRELEGFFIGEMT